MEAPNSNKFNHAKSPSRQGKSFFLLYIAPLRPCGKGLACKILFFCLLGMVVFSQCTSDKQKPNIIFLLTDDQRWDALGAAGNNIIQTPNLDKLANQGIMFTNAQVTTSICFASRASILTGQYTARHGSNNFFADITGEALNQTYPLLLKQKAGYKIGFIGKYGVGYKERPVDSFDYWGCEPKHQPDYENINENGDTIHYTDIVDGRIKEFLNNFSDKGPFCLSVSFKAPHCQDGDPRQFIYHPRYKNLYADVEIPLPETYDSAYYSMYPHDFKNRYRRGNPTENEARARWRIRFPNKEKYQESVRSYYRLITGVDDVVGNMVQQLKDLGIDDNTIIIFMGDNGFYLGEHSMAGKWYAHQESLKVPFFIYDPKVPDKKRGLKVDDFALNIDVAPTILSYAGIEAPEKMQGIDVVEMADNKDLVRNEFYYEHLLNIPTIPKTEAVVSKDWKYIVYPELKEPFEELYNLQADPFEKNNLAYNPEYADKLEQLKKRMIELKAEAQ